MTSEPTLIVVGLVRHGSDEHGSARWIVTRRRAGTHLAGAWELPGGKVETGEAPADALSREVREELGVLVAAPEPLTFSHHRYPDRTLLLLFYETSTLAEGAAPQPLAADALRLVTLDELVALEMPPANEPLRRLLRRRLETSS